MVTVHLPHGDGMAGLVPFRAKGAGTGQARNDGRYGTREFPASPTRWATTLIEWAGSDRGRPLRVPVGVLLIAIGEGHEGGLGEGPPQELEGRGEVVLAQAVRHAERGQP